MSQPHSTEDRPGGGRQDVPVEPTAPYPPPTGAPAPGFAPPDWYPAPTVPTPAALPDPAPGGAGGSVDPGAAGGSFFALSVPGSPRPGPVEQSGAAGSRWVAPRHRIGLLIVGAAVISLLVGLLGGVVGGWAFEQVRQNSLRDRSISLPAPARGSTARASGSTAGIAGRVLPSVVAIKIRGDNRSGYILTNNHVVEAASDGGSITVVYSDGSHASARVVGQDKSYDLAVVKADIGDRAALKLGDSEGVVVGDSVIAVGAPLGLQGTVTTGIVSALNRPVAAGGGQTQAFINAIQTDAAINPGNSGGPLVDASGQVIGINSAIARAPGSLGTSSGSIGVGFAIPSNQARKTAEQLIRTGHSEHPVIGVLLDRAYTGQGVKVSTTSIDGQPPVTVGGPADKAGIKPGDLIIAFNGRPVADPDELVVSIRAQTPGDVVRFTIRRDGSDREVRVILQASSK
jgi:putative serine protease PepD